MPNRRFSQRFLTLKRNENPGPQETAQHSPLGSKKVVQTLSEVITKKEKVLATIENPKPKTRKRVRRRLWLVRNAFNDSDSPKSEKTKVKTKQWENYQD